MSQSIDLGRIRFYYQGTYDANTTYEMNDVVSYGGSSYIYISNTSSANKTPDTATFFWSKIAEGSDFRGQWSSSTEYFPNDIVIYGNAVYICASAHTSNGSNTGFYTDYNLSRWTLLTYGFKWEGAWAADTLYQPYDVVSYAGNTYLANSQFTSNTVSFDNDTEWILFAQGSAGGEVATQSSNSGKLLSTDGISTEWVSNISINDVTANTLNLADTANVGPNAGTFFSTLTNPIAVYQIDAPDFAQLSFRNLGTNANSSTDIICYADIGDDDTGWIDMGITSTNFSDPEFTITGPHDGYIFVEGPANSIGGGNLVLATGGHGTDNAIIFAAGGLLSDNTQMTIFPDQNVHVEIATNSTSPTTGALTVVGGIGTQGNINLLGDLSVQGSITVAGGAFQAETLVSTAPLLTTGDGATADDIERGFIVEYKRPTSSSSFLIGSVESANSVLTIRRKSFTTISKALTSNIATVVLTESPDIVPGETIVISNLGAPFDGTFTVNTVSSSTITYDVTASDVGVTADGDGDVAPNIDSSIFVNGDRLIVANSATSAINGNRDFVIAVSGNTITTNFGATVISNTATDGDVSVNTKTAYSGLVRADSVGSNKWYLYGNIPPVLSNGVYNPPTNNIDLSSGTLVGGTLVLGGLEFPGATTINGELTFTGNSTFNTDSLTVSNTFALGTSTVTGNPTLSGNPTFSGTPSFTGSPTFTGTPVFTGGVRVQEMIEDVVSTNPTGADLEADYSAGNIFYISPDGQTMSLKLSNVPTTDNRIFTVNCIVNQGSTGYGITSVWINDVAQTLRWASAATPIPSANKIDVFNFSIARIGGNYIVLGSANLGF